MSSDQVCDALNRIIAIHDGSLAIYLSDAVPWVGDNNSAQETVSSIASQQRATIDRLVCMVLDLGGDVRHGSFASEFAGYHDLSLDFLLREMISLQQANISTIESVAEGMAESAAKSVAEETLGSAREQLMMLGELSATPAIL